MLLLRLISYLPFSVLYVSSDILAFLAHKVFGYRRKVILKNLTHSFPEKSKSEIEAIAKDYYINLSDIVVETIKSLTISAEALQGRVKIHNLQVLEDHLKGGQSVITMTSHQGNWEWLLLSNSLAIKSGDVIAAFQEVHKLSDYMLMIRSRFGAQLIEKKNIVKEMIKKDLRPKVYALVADQTPNDLNNSLWMTFLHQDTAFFTGAEKIAKKYNMVVLFVHMHRIKRGYYEVDFTELSKPPYVGSEVNITQLYVKHVEQEINKNPAQWLWSHNRWKHKKQPLNESN